MISPRRGSFLLWLLALVLAVAEGATSSADLELPPIDQNNIWYSPTDSPTVIVFVHGVLSDSRGCWLNERGGGQHYWPAMIRDDPRFDDAAIYLGGYYTEFDSGPYEVRNAAEELFAALNRPDKAGKRPPLEKPNLIFVGHSLGGVVVRYLLESNYQSFAAKNVGVVLIASPSYGTRQADRLAWLAAFYKNGIGQQLRWGSWTLRDLDARFRNLLDQRRIPHLAGVEAYENRFVIHRRFLRPLSTIVTEESAGRYFSAPVLLRNTDHFSAAKPDSERHPAYELLLDFYLHKFKPMVAASAGQPAAGFQGLPHSGDD